MANTNKTRPSYARVKVEVDLLHELPKRINVRIKKKSGEILTKWIQIKYDYLSKYCQTYKLQGHNEEDCFVLHPELFDDGKKEKDNKKEKPLEGGEIDKTKINGEGKSQKKGGEQQENRTGKDGNKRMGLQKHGITRWDQKPMAPQVNTANKFQILEEQKDDTNKATDQSSKQEELRRGEQVTPQNKCTK